VARVNLMIDTLAQIRDSVEPGLPIWPGCSVSARRAAETGRVEAVRPSSYVFGDMYLIQGTKVMSTEEAALTVLATVVDKPGPGFALIDAGSKTFSSDRTLDNIHGVAADGRNIVVGRVNEEHGYLRGADVDSLRVGERIRFIPAHVCPVLNLTDEVAVVEQGSVAEVWPVDARGRTQ
jgi:D-serine deaminase-like pyridoxal phosphate-dependent protein